MNAKDYIYISNAIIKLDNWFERSKEDDHKYALLLPTFNLIYTSQTIKLLIIANKIYFSGFKYFHFINSIYHI